MEGAFVGGMMAGVRYAAGRVVVTIQDFVLAVGLSDFWAAVDSEKEELAYIPSFPMDH